MALERCAREIIEASERVDHKGTSVKADPSKDETLQCDALES